MLRSLFNTSKTLKKIEKIYMNSEQSSNSFEEGRLSDY